jgi:hypothetical protein
MNNALKGAMWSGLIWPGLGQVVLKRYKRGIAIVLAVGVILTVIVVKAARFALAILDKIDLQGGPIDAGTIYNAAVQASAGTGGLSFNLLSLLMVVLWVVGIVDAYRIGRQLDLKPHGAPQSPIGGRQ